jgi:hypothetical protein
MVVHSKLPWMNSSRPTVSLSGTVTRSPLDNRKVRGFASHDGATTSISASSNRLDSRRTGASLTSGRRKNIPTLMPLNLSVSQRSDRSRDTAESYGFRMALRYLLMDA